MLLLQGVSYHHPNKEILFKQINLAIQPDTKLAIVGNNGTGKSTLLQLMAGRFSPVTGSVIPTARVYYIAQIVAIEESTTVAELLNLHEKYAALKAILNGDTSERQFNVLNDDWTLEERCTAAFTEWGLDDVRLNNPVSRYSGGEITRLLLAGISIHQPELVLMDEPSNHLDAMARERLYDFVSTTPSAIVLVSHDRKLLHLVNQIAELRQHTLHFYGGNFSFFKAQKSMEDAALQQDLRNAEKTVRKAKQKERETAERQQKLDARGRKKQEKAGTATIMLNTLRNNAEKSTAKLKDVHAEKISGLQEELMELRKQSPDKEAMRLALSNTSLHKGKQLFTAQSINFGYTHLPIWQKELNFTITSGERMALKGGNGSGKTTLIRLLLGQLRPAQGNLQITAAHIVYLDQHYSLLDGNKSVLEQATAFNSSGLLDHEIKNRLNRFLFTPNDWDTSCNVLSGGERMRLCLCCLTLGKQAPDCLILDEPTNNLDLQNIEILTDAISGYKGTLIVVSHDAEFLNELNLNREIDL